MPSRTLDPHNLGDDEDWEGNNAAFRCPHCGALMTLGRFLTSAALTRFSLAFDTS